MQLLSANLLEFQTSQDALKSMFRPGAKAEDIVQSIRSGIDEMMRSRREEIGYLPSSHRPLFPELSAITASLTASSKTETRSPFASETRPSMMCIVISSPCESQLRMQRAARLSLTRREKYLAGCERRSQRSFPRVASIPIFIKFRTLHDPLSCMKTGVVSRLHETSEASSTNQCRMIIT